MTNYEKIKNMSLDEMLDFLEKWRLEDINYSLTFCDFCKGQYDCVNDCMRKWLESEVEENA